MFRPLIARIVTSTVIVVASCSAPPAKQPEGSGASAASGPIDLRRSAQAPAQTAWPPGLVPCPKDAPAGEGCATPSAARGSGAVPTPQRHAPVAHSGEADATIWKVPVGPDDPVRGPVGAPVTVVEFSDFECPFCKREAAIMKQLLAEFAEDVRLVWKDCPLPMHANAEPAAELARAARASQGDAGFWKVHDALYQTEGGLGDDVFRAIAKDVGLRWDRVSADVRGARYGEKIRAGVALSDRVDVPATPTVFVNGRKLVGAQPYEKLRALVAEERDKAKKSLGSSGPGHGPTGSPGGNGFYDALISAGKQVEPPTDLPPP